MEWEDDLDFEEKGLKRERTRKARRKMREVLQSLDEWDGGEVGREPWWDTTEDFPSPDDLIDSVKE